MEGVEGLVHHTWLLQEQDDMDQELRKLKGDIAALTKRIADLESGQKRNANVMSRSFDSVPKQMLPYVSEEISVQGWLMMDVQGVRYRFLVDKV